jgi:hypothetical protein
MRNVSLTLVLALLLLGCSQKPKITFVQAGEGYAEKPDFALVEYEHPIPLQDLARITPKYLAGRTQEELDQIYARLSAGPIPNGPFDGSIVFSKGSSGKFRATEIIGGLKGLAAGLGVKSLQIAGETLWKGKVFYRDQRVLRNRIEDLAILRPIVGPGDIPKIDVDGKDAWLLFPAKLYCGESLLDARRESIIIDYAYGDELPGYRDRVDYLAGRNGLKVRDEIRMVHPGLYLGRAYLDRVFALNFVLENKSMEKQGEDAFAAGKLQEDCWPGTQKRVLAQR